MKLEPEDLIKYGLIPSFIGECNYSNFRTPGWKIFNKDFKRTEKFINQTISKRCLNLKVELEFKVKLSQEYKSNLKKS